MDNDLIFFMLLTNIAIMSFIIIVPAWGEKFKVYYDLGPYQLLAFYMLIVMLAIVSYLINVDNIYILIGLIAAIIFKLDIIIFKLTNDLSNKESIHHIQVFIGFFTIVGLLIDLPTFI